MKFLKIKFSPMTKRRIDAFKSNKRGYYSLILFLIMFIISLPAEFIANDKPLFILYDGKIFFPVLMKYADKDFGGSFETEADYRDNFTLGNIKSKGLLIWPPVKFSFNTINYNMSTPAPSPPSTDNLLGTDDRGCDVLANLIYGFRISIVFALILTVFGSIVGVCAGAVQGYYGGKLDLIFQRFIEVWSSLPVLYIIIIVTSILGQSFWLLLVLLLLFEWTSLVGLVRAEFLRTRNFDYIKAAKALGVNNTEIMFKHILPNAVVSTLTYLPLILNGSIATLISLDFLNLGLPLNYPSLGRILSQGKTNLQAPWIGITGFVFLSIMLTLLIYIGEAVRDAFNPRKILK